jgi:hypothetical protein
VTNAETTILYALSTLAQTCAALAAFVGVVGIYKLQSLDAEQARHEATTRGLGAPMIGGQSNAYTMPMDKARETFDSVLAADAEGKNTGYSKDTLDRLRAALAKLDRFPQRRRRVIRWLWGFEGWNLLVILASLVGFNHVMALAACPWTLRGLWPVALVTVVVTGYGVFVWTRE